MATFEIDTGVFDQAPALLAQIPDWFLDQYTVLPDESRALHDYGYHLIGWLQDPNGPKKMATVRKHFLCHWVFLRNLAEQHPDVFDELLAAYAERWQQ